MALFIWVAHSLLHNTLAVAELTSLPNAKSAALSSIELIVFSTGSTTHAQRLVHSKVSRQSLVGGPGFSGGADERDPLVLAALVTADVKYVVAASLVKAQCTIH